MDIELTSDILVSPIQGFDSYVLFQMPITGDYQRVESGTFVPARTEWMLRMDAARMWAKEHLIQDTEVLYMGSFMRWNLTYDQTFIKGRISFASEEDAVIFFLHFK